MKLDGQRALRARERLGYSAADAAREAGVATNSVLRAEHGEDIRPATARKLAAGLGVSVADLISGEAELSGKSEAPRPEPAGPRGEQRIQDRSRFESYQSPFADALVNRRLERAWHEFEDLQAQADSLFTDRPNRSFQHFVGDLQLRLLMLSEEIADLKDAYARNRLAAGEPVREAIQELDDLYRQMQNFFQGVFTKARAAGVAEEEIQELESLYRQEPAAEKPDDA